MKKRLLLISNSTCYGSNYLDHCQNEIQEFMQGITDILFIPFALHDVDMYESLAKDRFKKMGILLTSLHRSKDQKSSIEKAHALFVGGGNTFRLLNELYIRDIISTIREKIEKGMPYIGTSAGSNIACPTIKTTNDMPIVYPPTFDALNTIPFQINPHFIDAMPHIKHMGETREKRIKEFHEENTIPVIGLREGSWLRIEDQSVKLKGETGAVLFEKGKEPLEYTIGANLDFLLSR